MWSIMLLPVYSMFWMIHFVHVCLQLQEVRKSFIQLTQIDLVDVYLHGIFFCCGGAEGRRHGGKQRGRHGSKLLID